MILWLFGIHSDANSMTMALGGFLCGLIGLMLILMSVLTYRPGNRNDRDHLIVAFLFLVLAAVFVIFGIIAGVVAALALAITVVYALGKGIMILASGS